MVGRMCEERPQASRTNTDCNGAQAHGSRIACSHRTRPTLREACTTLQRHATTLCGGIGLRLVAAATGKKRFRETVVRFTTTLKLQFLALNETGKPRRACVCLPAVHCPWDSPQLSRLAANSASETRQTKWLEIEKLFFIIERKSLRSAKL